MYRLGVAVASETFETLSRTGKAAAPLAQWGSGVEKRPDSRERPAFFLTAIGQKLTANSYQYEKPRAKGLRHQETEFRVLVPR